jgi:hypothetical protein
LNDHHRLAADRLVRQGNLPDFALNDQHRLAADRLVRQGNLPDFALNEPSFLEKQADPANKQRRQPIPLWNTFFPFTVEWPLAC